MLVTLRQLLDHAAEHDYGVPAFNINNMEQGLAILAADKLDAPVIIQPARGRSYAGDLMLQPNKGSGCDVSAYSHLAHQDHGNLSHPYDSYPIWLYLCNDGWLA